MINPKGEPIGESKPFGRDPSRQLTVGEYATMKNNEHGLKSQVSEVLLNKSQRSIDEKVLEDRDLFSRIKPDSA